MKIGFRKPNLKKSIKARTTGKVKRAAKRAVNPLYGKKDMGWVNDPKKAAYNKIYNKTTKSVFDNDTSYDNNYGVDGCAGCTQGCCGCLFVIVIIAVVIFIFS